MQKGRAKNGNARCFFFFSPSSLGASMSCWLLLALVLAKTMEISPSEDEAACQTHEECSEERVARAVHTINSARAGICEARGEEGHMLGAGRCEWHECVLRAVRDMQGDAARVRASE